MKHTMVWENGQPRLDWKPVTVTKWQTPGKDLLGAVATERTMRVRSDLALRLHDGRARSRSHEVDRARVGDAPRCLDIIKDQQDGSLSTGKLPDDDLRLLGHAMRRRRARCKTRMYDIVQSGHVPVISAMGNLPIVKDLVVDMQPFWDKFHAVKPWLQPGYEEPPDGKEYIVSQEKMNPIHKESLCINCGCCVSECNAMESEPEFLGPQALAKAFRFVGDLVTIQGRPARDLNASTGSGSAPGVTSATSAAPRRARVTRSPSSAPSRSRRDRPRHGREARKWFGPRRRRPAGSARPSSFRDARCREGDQADALRDHARAQGQVPPPVPPPVAHDVESRASSTT